MIPATAFTILFALWCSRDDAQQIARHSKIYHGLQWSFRAALVVAVCYWWASWWLALGMAGLFSAVFRWDLNGRRDDWWWYLGPRLEERGSKDSLYDTALHWIAWTASSRKRDDEARPIYSDKLPGTMAYIFEALLFVGVVIAYL